MNIFFVLIFHLFILTLSTILRKLYRIHFKTYTMYNELLFSWYWSIIAPSWCVNILSPRRGIQLL